MNGAAKDNSPYGIYLATFAHVGRYEKPLYSLWLRERFGAFLTSIGELRPATGAANGVSVQTEAEWLDAMRHQHRDAFRRWLISNPVTIPSEAP